MCKKFTTVGLVLAIVSSVCLGKKSPATSTLDSLNNILDTASDQPTRLDALHSLGQLYFKRGSYDTAIVYSHQLQQLAQQVGNTKKELSALFTIGLSYKHKSDYDTAEHVLRQALTLSKEQNLPSQIASSYHNLGVVYQDRGQYDSSLYYLNKSIRLKKEAVDSPNLVSIRINKGVVKDLQGHKDEALSEYFKALNDKKHLTPYDEHNIYNNIGTIYLNQNRLDKALKYFKKSLTIRKSLQLKDDVASSYGNMAGVYYKRGDYKKALEFTRKGLRLKKEIGSKAGLSRSYTHLVTIFTALHHKSQDTAQAALHQEKPGAPNYIDSARFYTRQAYRLSKQIGNRGGRLSALKKLGHLHYKQNHYRQAIASYKKGLAIADSMGAHTDIYEIYERISLCYEHLNQPNQALRYYKKYIEVRDSLQQQEIAEIEAQYQRAKRKKRIKVLKKEKEKQTAIAKAERRAKWQTIYFVSGGVLLILLFSGFLYNRFRVTQSQKQVIEQQKQLVEEKNKAITDSINYAQKIQSAILQAEEELNHLGPDNYFVFFQPKETVSGDFYWAYHDNNTLIWAVADCTGHGVPGAFMSMIGNRLLNEVVIEKGITDTDQILNRLREGIINTLQQKGEEEEMRDGMDMALCKLKIKNGNTQKRQVEFTGAKNPLYIVGKDITKRPVGQLADKTQGKNLIEISGDKQPIGYEQEDPEPFTKHELELQPGDQLYMFSDGFPDQFGGPHGKKFMYYRFKKLFREMHKKPMEKQKQHLGKILQDWMAQNNEEQIDDICILGVRV